MSLAAKAKGRTSPNPLVGAILVKDGMVVGQGYHTGAGTPHAEIHALNMAGSQAQGATLYVTLEPCCHQGRTGPCTEALIQAKVAKVVAAMLDPNPLVAGKGMARLQKAGIVTKVGLLEEQARTLNEVFITYMTQKRPFVLLKAAMSLDGKIATRTGESQWITGEEARIYGHQLRDCYDAILVGINTVLADNPSLTTRLPGRRGKDPVRIILDTEARTPPKALVLRQDSPASTLVVISAKAPEERVQALKNAGAKILKQELCQGRIDIKALLQDLAAREMTSLLVEGGGQVHASMLAAGVVDKVVWLIAPKLIGGSSAPGPVGGMGIASLQDAVELKQVSMKRFGADIGVIGYVQNHAFQ